MPSSIPSIRLPEESAPSSRKTSIAATLHANFIGFGSAGNSNVVGSARRRLSNVSDAVSRKLSRWRINSISIELTVSQGLSLCAQYIRNRMKRAGVFHRKLGLKRMRSSKMLPSNAAVNDVHLVLTALGIELEKMHENLFTHVARQTGYGTFSSEQNVVECLSYVSREIIRDGEINWSKIVAIYAVAGGAAVDCVRQGNPELIPAIQRAMAAVLEEEVAAWIQANGGWSTLVTRYRPAPKPKDLEINCFFCFLSFLALLIALGIARLFTL